MEGIEEEEKTVELFEGVLGMSEREMEENLVGLCEGGMGRAEREVGGGPRTSSSIATTACGVNLL